MINLLVVLPRCVWSTEWKRQRGSNLWTCKACGAKDNVPMAGCWNCNRVRLVDLENIRAYIQQRIQ